MRRMDARRRNASALRFRHSQSLASRRHRLSHAMVRSTIQRFGRTVNPFAASERFTISTSTWRMIRRKATRTNKSFIGVLWSAWSDGVVAQYACGEDPGGGRIKLVLFGDG